MISRLDALRKDGEKLNLFHPHAFSLYEMPSQQRAAFTQLYLDGWGLWVLDATVCLREDEAAVKAFLEVRGEDFSDLIIHARAHRPILFDGWRGTLRLCSPNGAEAQSREGFAALASRRRAKACRAGMLLPFELATSLARLTDRVLLRADEVGSQEWAREPGDLGLVALADELRDCQPLMHLPRH